METVFAPSGRITDGILRERIRQARDPRELIVVASDRQVIAAARAGGAWVLRSEEFAAQLDVRRIVEAPEDGQDVYLSEKEVEEWLRMFARGDGE